MKSPHFSTGLLAPEAIWRRRPSRPVGRVLYLEELRDGDHPSSPDVTVEVKRPTREFGPGALNILLFGLAPRGVWPAS